MLRLIILVVAAAMANPSVGRALEGGGADIAQRSVSAVVTFSVWKMRPAIKEGEAPRRMKTYASGFIIDPSGIIVTNKHVMDGAIDTMVIFNDGNRAHGTLIAAAAMTDLALVKVAVARPLPVLTWGDSDLLRVGNPVLTIGNPMGIGMTVSAGIISALNRNLQDTPFDSYIQTDAAINRGNSGGPLISQNGEVIGVNTALYNTDPNGSFIGIGFAIPAADAQFVIKRLLSPSRPRPGWLGVKLQDVTPNLHQALGLPIQAGSIIADVDPAGPASKAGLRVGDVLEGIDATKPRDSRAFMRAIVMAPAGRHVKLTVLRDGKARQIDATIAEWPNQSSDSGAMSAGVAKAMMEMPPDWGLKLEPISDITRRLFGLDPKLSGVLVSAVEAGCEADDLGLVAGDVIMVAQGVPVATPGDVTRVLTLAHQQRRAFAALLVQGKDGKRWVSLSVDDAGT